jgi:hypothetical protein
MNNPDNKPMTPELADYRARCFVYGMRRHGITGKMEPASGEFASRFATHPWCREAITEGWAKDLRSHLVMTVKRRIMLGKPYGIIEELMPNREWVDAAKQNAARYRSAAEWRNATYGKLDGEYFLRKLGINRPVDKHDANGEIIE